jgi:peroxiredoxin family protein
MAEGQPRRLVILCHDGGWERLYQAASCAVTATSSGWRVEAVFYFAALEKLLSGRLDEVTFDPPQPERGQRLADRIDEIDTHGPASLFAAARATGNLGLYACSASCALLDRDPAAALQEVDQVVGWPTVMGWLERSEHALYF